VKAVMYGDTQSHSHSLTLITQIMWSASQLLSTRAVYWKCYRQFNFKL